MNNPIPNEQLKNEECRVFYEKYSMENLAWTASLALMSLTLLNFRGKIDSGHCNNTETHPHGNGTPRDCDLGRTFHIDMLHRCLQSYRDVINEFELLQQPHTGNRMVSC